MQGKPWGRAPASTLYKTSALRHHLSPLLSLYIKSEQSYVHSFTCCLWLFLCHESRESGCNSEHMAHKA